MRRSPNAMLRTLKRRVRRGAWQFSDPGFQDFVDHTRLKHADVERAVATGRLAGWFEDDQDRSVYVLCGFGMNEEPVVVICRLIRTRVIVSAALPSLGSGIPFRHPPPPPWQGRGWTIP